MKQGIRDLTGHGIERLLNSSFLNYPFTKLLNYQIGGERNEQSRALVTDLSMLWIKDP
jgi:hypothetical protein